MTAKATQVRVGSSRRAHITGHEAFALDNTRCTLWLGYFGRHTHYSRAASRCAQFGHPGDLHLCASKLQVNCDQQWATTVAPACSAAALHYAYMDTECCVWCCTVLIAAVVASHSLN
jgi:hypothetical protein